DINRFVKDTDLSFYTKDEHNWPKNPTLIYQDKSQNLVIFCSYCGSYFEGFDFGYMGMKYKNKIGWFSGTAKPMYDFEETDAELITDIMTKVNLGDSSIANVLLASKNTPKSILKKILAKEQPFSFFRAISDTFLNNPNIINDPELLRLSSERVEDELYFYSKIHSDPEGLRFYEDLKIKLNNLIQ
ncbi:MAG: hypothetical protein KW788_02580, partial [Candidatus Doudnabacteria bacterium]|nr:hypothetical protein [Candidatus Doudnabacteria bacterium]